jgi:hypothetical protein
MDDLLSHIQDCEEMVSEFARGLRMQVLQGDIRHDVTEALIDDFIEQPVFDPEHRYKLKRIASNQLGGW